MTELAAIVLLMFAIGAFLWAVVGLIGPEKARLPNRLASVGVWAVSFAMLFFSMTLSEMLFFSAALLSELSDASVDADVVTAPPRVVSQEELLQAFGENEVRAEQAYRRQRLQLTGLVGSVEASAWGSGGCIEFQDDLVREVEAYFEDRSVLTDLSRCQRIAVVCRDVGGRNVNGVRMLTAAGAEEALAVALVYVARNAAADHGREQLYAVSWLPNGGVTLATDTFRQTPLPVTASRGSVISDGRTS